MKVMTYNVRGLGGRVKCGYLKNLMAKEEVEMLCIQETKLELIDRALCQRIWGENDVEWFVSLTINRGRGLLCLWNKEDFSLQNSFHGQGFLAIKGIWKKKGIVITMVNVYSLRDID